MLHRGMSKHSSQVASTTDGSSIYAGLPRIQMEWLQWVHRTATQRVCLN